MDIIGSNTEVEPIDLELITTPIPKGTTLHRSGNYLRIANATGHPLASRSGVIPYHRFVLWEYIGKPYFSTCNWCGYVLPWKSTLSFSNLHVICADHIDSNRNNNHPSNLTPSCYWCNSNRSWCQPILPHFWSQWTRWLHDVPPHLRPNLIQIAIELKLIPPAFSPSKSVLFLEKSSKSNKSNK